MPSRSSTPPPSSRGTAEGGYGRLNSRLRSILFHPVGLQLVRLFNDGGPDTDTDTDGLSRYNSNNWDGGAATQQQQQQQREPASDDDDERGGGGGGGSKFDGVLHEGYEAYQAKATEERLERKRKDPDGAIAKPPEEEEEEALAGILHGLISSQLPATLKACRCHQHGRTHNPTDVASKARTDILIRRDDDHHDKGGMVLLLEVAWGTGGDAELWWKKADQNAQYLDLLQDPANEKAEGAQFSGPLLFAVLIVDKERAKLDDPSRESAQLGVFLCAPRRPPLPAKAAAKAVAAADNGPLPGYRAALLWRDTFTTLAGASGGMGKTLRATAALAQMLRDPGRRDFKGFASLGPNCCRLGDKVTKSDDWHALLTVIFRVHMLPVPEWVTTIGLYKRRERFLGLIGSSATGPDAVSLTDSTVQGVGSELIGFLKDGGPWKISFSDSFRVLVMQRGGPFRRGRIRPREIGSPPATARPHNVE
jgi:hypothetical protein